MQHGLPAGLPERLPPERGGPEHADPAAAHASEPGQQQDLLFYM